jgi:hypothetical protein
MERLSGREVSLKNTFLSECVLLSLRSIWREADMLAGRERCGAREILRD